MFKAINPTDIVAPYGGAYNQAIEVPAGARMLYLSGQVGMAKDGTIPAGIEAQSEQLWINVTAILRDAGMTVNNIVKLNIYLTFRRSLVEFARNFPVVSRRQDSRGASASMSRSVSISQARSSFLTFR